MSTNEPVKLGATAGPLSSATDSPATKAPCPKCGAMVDTTEGLLKLFGSPGLCEACAAERDRKEMVDDLADRWRDICPRDYRDTDRKHDQWNAPAWDRLKTKGWQKNVVLLGKSGICKTRAAIELLKIYFFKGYQVGILFADEVDEMLSRTKGARRPEEVRNIRVLLLDDLFTAGAAYERYTAFVKGLIDYRLREGLRTIVTTNLTATEFEDDAGKFRNMSAADSARIHAIVRRMRGEFVSIDFNSGPEQLRF